MSWRAISRSVTGTRHLSQHQSCQDVGGERILGDVMIGAVADGAGSVRHSELGATLAVQRTLEYLGNLEPWLKPAKAHWPTLERPPLPSQARRLFERTITQVRTALQHCADQYQYAFEDLSCTLLIVVATPYWVAAMQIGDGLIVTRARESDYQLLFHPDKGEFVNQTSFVTTAEVLNAMQVTVIPETTPFVCVATDAFERLAIRIKDWTPHPPFFQPLEAYMHETATPAQDDQYIVNFLGSEYLNHHTDDDKTLLLCLNIPDEKAA